MVQNYSEIPEVIRAEMRKLQKVAQGKVDESVFERNPHASKTSGGFDWPREHYEAWSDALVMGQFDRLLKILEPKRKKTQKKQVEHNEEKLKRKYTRRSLIPAPTRKDKPAVEGAPSAPAHSVRKYDTALENLVRKLKDTADKEMCEQFGMAGDFQPRESSTKQDVSDELLPVYYQQLKGGDVLDMMIAVYGRESVKIFCELNAFKYRMRAGRKSKETVRLDIAKALWYEAKAKELCGAEK